MNAPESNAAPPRRRDFIATAGSVAMAGGLAASYGTLGAMAGRFLYPAGGEEQAWLYLTDVASMKPGDSFIYRAPTGSTIAVARVGSSGQSEDFLALSSVCPHLGCQVHWEAQNQRFFCPCHNGSFDATGKATGGPPAAAGQSLSRYQLRIEEGLLYIQVPVQGLSTADARPRPEAAGQGHGGRGGVA